MNYAFEFEGRAYEPGGRLDTNLWDKDKVTERNRETELKEIEWLKSAPEKVFLYVKDTDTTEESYQKALAHGWTSETTKREAWATHKWEIATWLGTVVSSKAYVGRRVQIGGIAGPHAFKRSVDCIIFGVRYTGWYWESAGDYCRLRKAKRQPK